MTEVVDLHGELTDVKYDGFGRMTQTIKPSPTTIGGLSGQPSVIVDYFLPTDASAQPYSLVHTQTQDAESDGTASYLEAWAYVDGMGRTILTLAEADPDGGRCALHRQWAHEL